LKHGNTLAWFLVFLPFILVILFIILFIYIVDKAGISNEDIQGLIKEAKDDKEDDKEDDIEGLKNSC